MSTTLQRLPLTDAVLAALETTGKPIGDSVLPDAAWIGEPNVPGSHYDPFAVLSSLRANQSIGTIGESQCMWDMPYLIESFGVLRTQCEWMADQLRTALSSLVGQTFELGPTPEWKVIYIRHDVIGEAQRIDVADPEFFHAQDAITVRLSRERS